LSRANLAVLRRLPLAGRLFVDAADAVADFAVLKLLDAPVRRRKAFAAAAVRGLLVEELSPPIDNNGNPRAFRFGLNGVQW
jgi:hypothetical protein